MLSGNIVSSAANLKQLLVGNPNVLGVFGAFKRLRGRPFRISDNDQDIDSQDAITLEAKELKISIPVNVFNVFTDPIIQRSLHGILTPLKNQNMDEIVIRDGDGEEISLKSEDFDALEDYEEETSNTIDIPNQNLSVSAPSLDKPHNKWRLHDGQTTHWYSVLDENFIRRVENNEIRFGTGDVLTCHVRIIQRISNSNTITARYEIIEVIAHRENERQLSFLDKISG